MYSLKAGAPSEWPAMTSFTHFWISSGVAFAGSKLSLEEGFGGSGVVSFLVSGDEVGGRWEESGGKGVGEVIVEIVLSEDEYASRREAADSLWLIC